MAFRVRAFVTASMSSALAVSACSAIVTFDGLANEVPRDASSDASSDANADATPPADGDAALDAGDSGAVSKLDAGDGSRRCDQPHTFCDDFDRGSYDPSWVVEPGPGAIAVDDGGFTSPSSSLVTIIAPTAKSFGADLLRTFSSAGGQTLTCSFDLMREAVQSAPLKAAELLVADGAMAPALHFGLYSATSGGTLSQYDDKTSSNSDVDAPGLATAVGEWHRVTIVADGTGVTVSIDGAVVSTNPYARTLQRTNLTLGLGSIQINAASAEWRVRYDDVVCDLQ